jgi:hypothetical protein
MNIILPAVDWSKRNTPAGEVTTVKLVQLRRLEARDISYVIQKGKKRLYGCPVLCLSPLREPPPIFYPQGGTSEEAHGSPDESEVLHGNH